MFATKKFWNNIKLQKNEEQEEEGGEEIHL
jgi:hypothetical protein